MDGFAEKSSEVVAEFLLTLSKDGKCAKILSDGKYSFFSVPFPLDGKGTKRSSRR